MHVLRIALAACLLLGAVQAQAWNAAGHRLVAAIAWRQMSPAARDAAAQLLARHPDYPRWIARAGDDPAYTAFLEAATWPDDIRSDRRFFDADSEPPTPPLPGLADTARHKDWHYVDVLPDGSRRGELDRQLVRLAGILRHRHASQAERTYALPWLIHLVADAHQPLHVGVHDDEGGNQVSIENPLNPRFSHTNLHTWWDDLPGPPWLRGKRLETVADALLVGPEVPAHGPTAEWLEESRALARQRAYPPADGNDPPVITSAFRDQCRALANQRLVAAGRRLGRLLEDALAGVSRETP